MEAWAAEVAHGALGTLGATVVHCGNAAEHALHSGYKPVNCKSLVTQQQAEHEWWWSGRPHRLTLADTDLGCLSSPMSLECSTLFNALFKSGGCLFQGVPFFAGKVHLVDVGPNCDVGRRKCQRQVWALDRLG